MLPQLRREMKPYEFDEMLVYRARHANDDFPRDLLWVRHLQQLINFHNRVACVDRLGLRESEHPTSLAGRKPLSGDRDRGSHRLHARAAPRSPPPWPSPENWGW